MADGRIIIDTEIDSTGAEKDVKGLNGKLGNLAKTSIKVITGLIAGATTALGGLATAAIKIGMDFEAQMSRVKSISGATASEFQKLNDLAIQLGADTAFSAYEAAQGMENLASAGFTVSEIMDAMPGMLDLAASSGEDLAVSADIAASTLRGFGLSASEAGHVADVLAKNAADTNAAVYDTGEAMKYVAPVASSLGLSLEEVTAAIGLMSNAGIQGSQAGTTLRAALTRLVKPTDDMCASMEKIGFNAFDSNGKMKSLSDMISELKSGMEGWTDEAKSNALATIFGTEALSGMMALVNAGPDEIDKLTESYIKSDGAAQQMAKTMQDNLKGGVEALGGSLETLGIQFYQSVDTPLNDIVNSANSMVDELSKAFSENGFDGLVSQLGNTLSTIITQIASNTPKIIKLGVDLIQSFVSGIIDNLPAIATGTISIVTSLVDGLIELLPLILDAGLQLIIALCQGIAESIPELLPKIIDCVIKMCDTFIENLPLIIDVAIQIILALIQGLVQALPQLIAEVPRIINSLSDAIYGQLPTILMAGIKIIGMLIMGLIQSIPTLVANMPQIIMAIVNAVTLYNWAGLGKNLITWLGNGISGMKGNIGTIAKNVATGVEQSIKNIFSGGLSWGKNLISSIGQGFSSMISFLGNSARSVATSALTAIKNKFTGAADIGKNLIQGIWNGINNTKQWILNKIGGFAGSIISGIKKAFDIHSPSRVMRDLIGVNLVKGIGVGVDIETPNLQKDIDSNMSDLVAKMQSTVDYETSMTRSRINPNISSLGNSSTIENTGDNNVTIKVPVILDGREVAEVTTPYSDKISGKRLSLVERGLALG